MPKIAFRMERQKAQNWCWAAVAVSVARFHDSDSRFRQCGVVRLVLSRAHREGDPDVPRPVPPCCTKPVPRACNQPWYLEEGLDQVGRRRLRPKSGSLSFEKIRKRIDADRPVCARIAWKGGGGHFVVISGYHVSRNGVRQVDVEDPLTGPALVNYSDFVRRYRGEGKWSHTYLV